MAKPTTDESDSDMTNVYYNSIYTAAKYAFETTRKSGLIADSLGDHAHARIVDPHDHTDQTILHLADTHDPRYVAAVQTGTPVNLAEQQGFEWDPGIFPMATAHAAGLVAAVNHVLTTDSTMAGTLSSGLHHARYKHGAGFCTFNGLSIATREAFRLGADRVLVLDFDAHAGGGTRETTDHDRVVQVDVTVSPFDLWKVANDDDLLMVAPHSEHNYLDLIDEALDHAASVPFDVVLYNAGMDPANSYVTFEELAIREQYVYDWAVAQGKPLVYSMAGGYLDNHITWSDIVDLHRFTIDTFTDSV